MPTQMSKSQLIEKIATTTELSKRDVKSVMETLTEVGHKELKKNGLFLVPGFAKFVVVKKPATKARKGTNPFTGEEMMFKAKPARKIVRARPGQGGQGRRGLIAQRPPRARGPFVWGCREDLRRRAQPLRRFTRTGTG
ncbi:nucleoid DNA-binding protein [Bradyrhizobium sp. LM6.10]